MTNSPSNLFSSHIDEFLSRQHFSSFIDDCNLVLGNHNSTRVIGHAIVIIEAIEMTKERVVLKGRKEEFWFLEDALIALQVILLGHVRGELQHGLAGEVAGEALLEMNLSTDVVHHFHFLVERQAFRFFFKVELVSVCYVFGQSFEVRFLVRAEKANNFDFLIAILPIRPVAIVAVEHFRLRGLVTVRLLRSFWIVKLSLWNFVPPLRLLHLVVAHEESIVAFDFRIDPFVSFLPHVLLQGRPILENFLAINANQGHQFVFNQIN